MNHSVLHKSLALTLVFLMIFSSSGFSMDLHFCNGSIKSTSILGKAKSCAERMGLEIPTLIDDTKSTKEKCHLNRKSCCVNHRITVEGIDYTIQKVHKSSKVQNSIAVLIDRSSHSLCSIEEQVFKPLERYIPPNYNRDFQVLFQSFLI